MVLAKVSPGGLRGAPSCPLGAIALRVERVVEQIEKPVWCVEYRDRIVEVTPPPPDPAQAAAIVLTSPRACRAVLDSLTDAANRAVSIAASTPPPYAPQRAC